MLFAIIYTHQLSLHATGCHVSQFPTSCLSESSAHRDFQSHLPLSNLGIDGVCLKMTLNDCRSWLGYEEPLCVSTHLKEVHCMPWIHHST